VGAKEKMAPFHMTGLSLSLFKNLFMLFFGCGESSLLQQASLALTAGATLSCGVWASHCDGFSCCGARALGTWAE